MAAHITAEGGRALVQVTSKKAAYARTMEKYIGTYVCVNTYVENTVYNLRRE